MSPCDAQIIMNGYPHLDNKAEFVPPRSCINQGCMHPGLTVVFFCRYSFNERASDIMTTGNLIVLVLLLNRLSLSFLTSVPPSQPMRGNTVGSIEQLLRAYRFQGDM